MECFCTSAHVSAVLPLVFRSAASALASSSVCTIVVLTLAPRCSSIRTTAACPPTAALISNVVSPCSAEYASTPPPPSSHAATTCASPSAPTSSVEPLCSAHLASTSPPSSSHAATSPLSAAPSTASGSLPPTAGLGSHGAAAAPAATALVVALAFFFLPVPFWADASFSASTSASSSVAAAVALTSASAICSVTCCRSSCAISVCFSSSATVSAVLLLVVCSEASAFASSSACTIVVGPFPLLAAVAHIRAVEPKVFGRLTLAPRCSSIRTIASLPPMAVVISNVVPLHSAQPASTPPPSSSHLATTCALSFLAAVHTVKGSPSPKAAGSPSAVFLGALFTELGEDLVAARGGAALAFFFLPLPFLAAASFSAASSASSSTADALAAAVACASASAACRLVCCRSSCAVAVCFSRSAHMSAVLIGPHEAPPVVCSEASALASSSACTIVVRPLIAALIRAVTPKGPCRLMLAPRWRIIRTIASCPTAAAPVSSVTPSYSEQPASTPPPSSSHAATTCASPSRAASQTPAGGPSPSGLGSTNKVAAGFFIRDLPAACPID
eukprot:scaffold51626_cov73-Phaeocystis_antarctica.AAC.2